MKLCMIGTGYVGLVSGVCFSDLGNTVYCVDNDIEKINALNKGILPIYEPGLEEILKRNYKQQRLIFTNNLKDSDLCITRAGASSLAELSFLNIPFISVPLPSSKDNHQLENANYYKNKNCCWTIEQKDFDSKIEEILINILNDKNTYLEKKENLKKLNYQNSWNNVNQKILKIINEN